MIRQFDLRQFIELRVQDHYCNMVVGRPRIEVDGKVMDLEEIYRKKEYILRIEELRLFNYRKC